MFANNQNLLITNGTFTNTVNHNYYGIGNAEGIELGSGDNPAKQKPKELKICPLPVPTFTGRKDILAKMAEFFDSDRESQRVFVLHGLGGSGKSQLAFKFLQESKSKRFSDIFYVDATNEQTLRMDLEAIIPGDAESSAEASLRWLASQPSDAHWALFFDNADDVTLRLARFLPPCTSGNIIVTSRNQDLRILAGKNGDAKVSDMEDEDAKNLLLELSDVEFTKENEGIATDIVQDLHYFALAISQAGAFIRVNSSLSDYQRLYHRERDNLLQNVELQGRDPYEYAVYTTWRLSYDKLGPSSKTLLHICSLLHHEGISEEMFERAAVWQRGGYWLDEELGDLSEATELLNQLGKQDLHWNSYNFGQIVKNLRSYSLIEYNQQNSTYSIHPLVQHWSCNTLSTRLQNMKKQTITLICLSTPDSSQSRLDDHSYCRTLLKHITKSIISITLTNLTPFIAICLSRVYEEHGLWKEAEMLQVQVLEWKKLLLGEDHLRTLGSMNNLAVTYLNLGRLKEAEVLDVQVLEKSKRLLGEDDPHTVTSMGNLAAIYHNLGCLKEAEVLQVQVVEKHKLLLDEDHRDTMTSMHNLAAKYCDLGRPKEAEVLQVQVLEKRKLLLGDDHPHTMTSMAYLAATYHDLGRPKEAEVLQVQLLAKHKLLQGEDHPHTLIIMARLAAIYCDLGRPKEAELLAVQVLKKRRLLQGNDHPHTQLAMSSLAFIYRSQGRLEEAAALESEVAALKPKKQEAESLRKATDTIGSTKSLVIHVEGQSGERKKRQRRGRK